MRDNEPGALWSAHRVRNGDDFSLSTQLELRWTDDAGEGVGQQPDDGAGYKGQWALIVSKKSTWEKGSGSIAGTDHQFKGFAGKQNKV